MGLENLGNERYLKTMGIYATIKVFHDIVVWTIEKYKNKQK